ncbi:MAG TPA: radical SAM protein [Syntrophales bacterium]|nr:radical SAM protein [Syntrophales bacterium]HQM29025.1 radical SAM protein [Syntrophales bacterium]
MILLVHPPVSKPCEPPAGIAKIAGFLRNRARIRCSLLDANLAGLTHFLRRDSPASDTWTERAKRSLSAHLDTLRDFRTRSRFARYKHAVYDLNRLLSVSDPSGEQALSLANFAHRKFSPLRSADLLRMAGRPEENLFHAPLQDLLDDAIDRHHPSHVGFSLNYLSQALCTFAMVGMVKRRHPHIRVILGGGLVTSWMRRPGWGNPFDGLVDHMVEGPGEQKLSAILGAKIQRGEGEVVCPPDYNAMPLDAYLLPGGILPYSASSGCYWGRCLFCPERAEGNPYVPASPGQVLREIGILVARHRPALVHFLDNALSPALLQALAGGPLPVPWYGFARVTEHLADEDFCMRLKQSGCVLLQIGLESGDQGVLNALQKGVDLSVARKVLRCLKKAGIAAYVYLLFGTPPETPTGAVKTLRFTVEMSECISFLNVAIFNMPARGPETEDYRTSPFYEGDLSLYKDFVHPAGWDRKAVRAFLDREFRKHPAIAAILRRDPPIFTSNHAPFFTLPVASAATGSSGHEPIA